MQQLPMGQVKYPGLVLFRKRLIIGPPTSTWSGSMEVPLLLLAPQRRQSAQSNDNHAQHQGLGDWTNRLVLWVHAGSHTPSLITPF